jgi:DNA-binding MarR family transcriptional regulator
VLANLERDGLLLRQPDPSHGRVLRSELTKIGHARLGKAHAAVKVVEDRMVESFGKENASQLAMLLARYADDIHPD